MGQGLDWPATIPPAIPRGVAEFDAVIELDLAIYVRHHSYLGMLDGMFDGMLDGMFDEMLNEMLDGRFDGMFDGRFDAVVKLDVAIYVRHCSRLCVDM